MQAMQDLIRDALAEHAAELPELQALPQSRYDRSVWPTLGQFDWFCGQVLYALIRKLKPERLVEVSTSSGYSATYMGLALKRNGKGRLDTFELDPKPAAAAAANFRRFGVEERIHLHVGDARVLVAQDPGLSQAELLFLDSLHTAEFMLWFMEALVRPAPAGALFHVHDTLPWSARLRREGTAGRGLLLNAKRWVYDRFIGGIPAGERVWPKVKPPQAPGELPCYAPNETREALLANELALLMGPQTQAFLYDLAPQYPHLEPRRYDAQVLGRQDSHGRPFEWNESWWAYAGPAREALGRWRQAGCPLRPDGPE
jgi:predicted O-methyltransferase YrrM